jgi:hypothetical protein
MLEFKEMPDMYEIGSGRLNNLVNTEAAPPKIFVECSMQTGNMVDDHGVTRKLEITWNPTYKQWLGVISRYQVEPEHGQADAGKVTHSEDDGPYLLNHAAIKALIGAYSIRSEKARGVDVTQLAPSELEKMADTP